MLLSTEDEAHQEFINALACDWTQQEDDMLVRFMQETNMQQQSENQQLPISLLCRVGEAPVWGGDAHSAAV